MVKIIPVSELYGYNYSVNVEAAVRQQWNIKKQFSCIGNPKKSSMFLFFDDCSGEYITNTGEKILAPAGSLVYVPENSEYTLNFFNFKQSSSSTFGINFSLSDKGGTPFLLSRHITVFNFSHGKLFIEKIIDSADSALPCYGKMKSGMYDILTDLSGRNIDMKPKFDIIQKGIKYIENEVNQTLSISEIAALCNVTESYFRKLFKEYSGMSPAKYRINAKLKRSKDYLKHTNLNASEIADLLGFTDTSFFCKQFKAFTGETPLQYRNSHR